MPMGCSRLREVDVPVSFQSLAANFVGCYSSGGGMSSSVIVVNWNSGELLRRCLQALSIQTVPPEAVFVVDNDSSDGSAGAVADFPGFTLLEAGSNLGFAAGNNFALKHCSTEFVVMLNPDAFPEPDWLEHLEGAAWANPDCAAFGSRQLCLEAPGILDGIGDAYHISGLVWRQRHGQVQTDIDLICKEIFTPCAAAALYRRAALLQVGGFDEDYFCYVEDVDLGFRLRLAGYRAKYIPGAVVRHFGSATTGGQHSDFSIYHGHRNLVWTFVKDMPGALFWMLLPFHVALNLLTVLVFLFRGRGQVILRAKRDALNGLAGAWAKRGIIQSNRVATIGCIWRVLSKSLRKN